MSDAPYTPARRGDLVVVETSSVGQVRYAVGIATGVSRIGAVTTIRRLTGSEGERGCSVRVRGLGGKTAWVVSSERVNVDEVKETLEKHPWDDFESLRQVLRWLDLFVAILHESKKPRRRS